MQPIALMARTSRVTVRRSHCVFLRRNIVSGRILARDLNLLFARVGANRITLFGVYAAGEARTGTAWRHNVASLVYTKNAFFSQLTPNIKFRMNPKHPNKPLRISIMWAKCQLKNYWTFLWAWAKGRAV